MFDVELVVVPNAVAYDFYYTKDKTLIYEISGVIYNLCGRVTDLVPHKYIGFIVVNKGPPTLPCHPQVPCST